MLTEKYFLRNDTLKLIFHLHSWTQILDRQYNCSAITHFRLSEPDTPLWNPDWETLSYEHKISFAGV
jgi:hypothetical protein